MWFYLFCLALMSPFVLAKSAPSTLEGNSTRINLEGLSLKCKPDGTFSTGRRYRCGEERPYVELLMSYGDNEGSAVAHVYNGSDKANRFYSCAVKQTDKKLAALRCEEKIHTENPDENQLRSPIKPSLLGSTIPNSHEVKGEAGKKVYRGMALRNPSDITSLQSLGVKDIIIFKNSVNGDVEKEEKSLEGKFTTHHIPFPWHDLPSFAEPCQQTMEALRIIKSSPSSFFHCTVGEDRTGYLAGLYRLATTNEALKTIFEEEMCEHGYSFGDPEKPFDNVVLEIHHGLTLMFLKMAYLKDKGKWSWDKLDDSVCQNDPKVDTEFVTNDRYRARAYVCQTSTRYRIGP